jgi:Domain of unknown function (DUF4219)
MEQNETYKPDCLQRSKNYRTWKFSMQMVLMAKDLWGVVGGDATTDTKRRNGDVRDSGSDVSKAMSAFFDVRLQICLSSEFSEIRCWDRDCQKLDRSVGLGAGTRIVKNSTGSARSGAGMKIKNSTGLRRVQGQKMSKT